MTEKPCSPGQNEIHQGKNARASFLEFEGQPAIRKEYRYAKINDLPELLAAHLAHRAEMSKFYRIPTLYSVEAELVGDQHIITTVEERVFGLNAHRIIGQHDQAATNRLFRDIFLPLEHATLPPRKLSESFESPFPLPVFLDTKPEHFIDSDGMYFVDLFPPRSRGADGLIALHLPQIDIRPRDDASYYYGDLACVLGRFARKAANENPDTVPELAEATHELIEQFEEPFRSRFTDEFFGAYPNRPGVRTDFAEATPAQALFTALFEQSV